MLTIAMQDFEATRLREKQGQQILVLVYFIPEKSSTEFNI